jgi:hypothetical protein
MTENLKGALPVGWAWARADGNREAATVVAAERAKLRRFIVIFDLSIRPGGLRRQFWADEKLYLRS